MPETYHARFPVSLKSLLWRREKEPSSTQGTVWSDGSKNYWNGKTKSARDIDALATNVTTEDKTKMPALVTIKRKNQQ